MYKRYSNPETLIHSKRFRFIGFGIFFTSKHKSMNGFAVLAFLFFLGGGGVGVGLIGVSATLTAPGSDSTNVIHRTPCADATCSHDFKDSAGNTIHDIDGAGNAAFDGNTVIGGTLEVTGASTMSSLKVAGFHMEAGIISGSSTSFTACTGTCYVINGTPGVSSAVHYATGTYYINFNTGVFSQVPVCVAVSGWVGINSGAYTFPSGPYATATQFSFTVSGSIDAVLSFICYGQ